MAGDPETGRPLENPIRPVKDAKATAVDLVEEISETVHQRFNSGRGTLVPPPLIGRCRVSSMKDGEAVMDRADELLDAAIEDWPDQLEPDVYLELVQDGKHWSVEWVVDSAADEGSVAQLEGE